MKTYKQFIIQESFTKAELNLVHKDPNIQIGIEYEFYTTMSLGDKRNVQSVIDDYARRLVYAAETYSTTFNEYVNVSRLFTQEAAKILERYDDPDAIQHFTFAKSEDVFRDEDMMHLYEFIKTHNLLQSMSNKSELDELYNYDWVYYTVAEEMSDYAIQDAIYLPDIILNNVEREDELIQELFSEITSENTRFDDYVSLITDSIDGNMPKSSSELLQELPFEFVDRQDYTKWQITSDSSLSNGNGVEIVSPVMNIPEALSTMGLMFNFIDKNGFTDDTCGLHVNMSYRGKLIRDLDILKVAMFMDEGLVWKYFPDRENNHYARSMYDAILHGSTTSMDTAYFRLYGSLTETIDAIKRDIYVNAVKYRGINRIVSAMNDSSDRIEFRYLGGESYQKKFAEVQTSILNFGQLLNLGFNPELKKQEYILKLLRVLRDRLGNPQ